MADLRSRLFNRPPKSINLLPGMTAAVTIGISTSDPQSIFIPASALVSHLTTLSRFGFMTTQQVLLKGGRLKPVPD